MAIDSMLHRTFILAASLLFRYNGWEVDKAKE